MLLNLTDSLGNTAAVSTDGAELKSLKIGGQELIWQGSPDYWSGSSPFLFPIASNVRNDTVYIEGKPYCLRQHGFASRMPWAVKSQAENAVTLILTETEETLAAYPFHFALEAAYALQDGALSLTLTVRNQDSREMPYCLGTHPAFNVPFADRPDGKFTEYQVVFDQPEENSCPLYNGKLRQIDVDNREPFLSDERTLPLDYAVFDRVDTVIFDRLNSKKVALTDTVTGKKVILAYKNFDYIAFWTPHAPFLCMEPWQGLSACSDEDDNFLSKRGVTVLKPGQSRSHSLRFSLES